MVGEQARDHRRDERDTRTERIARCERFARSHRRRLAGAGAVDHEAPQRHCRPDLAEPIAPVRIVQIEEAALPDAPLPSNGALMLIVGGVLGLAIGLLAASLREAFDRRIRTPARRRTRHRRAGRRRDRRRIAGIRTSPLAARAGSRGASAGVVPRASARTSTCCASATAAGSSCSPPPDAVRAPPPSPPTSPSRSPTPAPPSWSSAPTLTCATPTLSAMFGLEGSVGLSGLLTGRTELSPPLGGSGIAGLTVVPAGSPAVNAGELIATPRMRTVLAEWPAASRW